ncbi:MAG TPA: PhzF family phenazine biosynthesis protein [Acidimicrobiales bacterium]|jgi:PhzF family phenazine biosynthesis protein|nr:PhzF family phenazine biosynthesis protein [Acidimicrobiales bacterium]
MQIYQVDAFSAEPFRGNPAAVCLVEGSPSDQWMQSVAAEMNLAETAFVTERPEGFGLRWFTPVVEVDLCGHATMASAHVLWELGNRERCLAFDTRSGRLTAERVEGGISLDLPADPTHPVEAPDAVAAALGVTPRRCARGRSFYLAELAGAAEVRNLGPDFGAIKALDASGVIVTAPGDDGVDFISRFFAPAMGIYEDPVTGAAHCCLAPYWASRLGRSRLRGYQASPRGGFVGVEARGDRVFVSGQAVTVLRGELLA